MCAELESRADGNTGAFSMSDRSPMHENEISAYPENNNLAQVKAHCLCLRDRRHDIAITFILLSLHGLNTFKSQVIRMKKSRKERLFKVTF